MSQFIIINPETKFCTVCGEPTIKDLIELSYDKQTGELIHYLQMRCPKPVPLWKRILGPAFCESYRHMELISNGF